MTHPKSETQKIGDVKIRCESFDRNLWFYRSIGGKVKVRGKKKKRRWWCLWLCKKPVKKKADSIYIQNTYYSSINDTPIPVKTASHQKTCTQSSGCKLHHWAFGFGVDIKFPDGGATPGTVDDLLPIQGVVTEARVTVDGETVSFTTATGIH